MMKRKSFILLVGVLFVLLVLSGCESNSKTLSNSAEQFSGPAISSDMSENRKGSLSSQADNETENEKKADMKMEVKVGSYVFTATLEDNAAADAFSEMMKHAPVVIQMSDYSGFEKVGALGASLPQNNSQITTQEGDIVLYNGNQIVMFYGSNSWSYTRLGKIDDVTGWKDALGNGDITVTFSME